jgi:hypothetical protein
MNDDCAQIRDKIAAAMAGLEKTSDSEAIAEHLRGCPECRAYRDALADDDRLLDSFVRSAGDAMSRLEDRVMSRVHAGEATASPREVGRPMWRSRPVLWFAAAAAVVIAVLAFSVLLETPGGGGVVWAEVITRIDDAKDFVCRRIEKRTGDEDLEMVEYRSSVHGLRQDIYESGVLQAVQYIVPDEKKMYALIHRDRAYVKSELTDEQVMEIARQSIATELVKSFREHEHRKLGRRRIEGVMAEGIEITDTSDWKSMFDEAEWRLWVDVKTQWPVRIELEGTAAEGSVRKTIVLKDFHWNATLTADDFAFEIPKDYKLIANLEPIVADEEHAVAGLRAYAKLVGGRYPSSLSLSTAIAEAERYVEKHDSYDERAGRDVGLLFEIRSTCNFYAELSRSGSDPAYYGDDVVGSDFDRVLLRWRLDDGRYRVIYGDLRAETVDSSRLEKLEDRP